MTGWEIIEGDCLQVLQAMPAESVQCVVTSPPYWGLRDYGITEAIGLEPTLDEFLAKLVAVFREVRRVLRADGTCWCNMGDGYASSGGNGVQGKHGVRADRRHTQERLLVSAVNGSKQKDLLGQPWRLAFALQADGWYLRQDIIWHKPNPMPESVRDRCTKSHEYVFLLTKSAKYYYDAMAIAEDAETEPHSPGWAKKMPTESGPLERRKADGTSASQWDEPERVYGQNGKRNKRSVWTISTASFTEAHFAVFPPALVEPCILAGTSAKGACPACGAPWRRIVERERVATRPAHESKTYVDPVGSPYEMHSGTIVGNRDPQRHATTYRDAGWEQGCTCPPAEPVPCVVLDPFSGAGTTVMVARRLGRAGIGIELNPQYAAMARKRITEDNPMFNGVA